MANAMSVETAAPLVESLLRPVCSLDHAIAGAVREGMSAEALSPVKRAVGQVMGLMYSYLGPCFRAAPELDPGRGGKPLGEGRVPLVSGSPETFLQLLDSVDEAVRRTQAQYDAAVPAEVRGWLSDMRKDLLDATDSGRRVITGHAG